MGALALTAALTGCNDSATGKAKSTGTPEADGKATNAQTVYRLGEASPPQESSMTRSKGSTFTVAPVKVETGTKTDMENSGLKLDKSDGPQVPVYVTVKYAHESGKAMRLGDMDDDLVVKTSGNQRTKALLVLLGQATWPNCPTPDTEKQLGAGQSETVCTAFLIPASQTPAAVELTQGYYNPSLEWPVKN
ncbi:hypothetical protein [Streptomyces deccanensis]|uniref:hypothetical protein n=1 Tax=Streptomyces deccanensis TaxID=424188 RepID=UPI001EFBC0ED|nr:hypothetical protein [Streptomyces deccanensis]ULR52360.1 hypothetical protein L3078_25470 [Streptomyces deccanensis]